MPIDARTHFMRLGTYKLDGMHFVVPVVCVCVLEISVFRFLNILCERSFSASLSKFMDHDFYVVSCSISQTYFTWRCCVVVVISSFTTFTFGNKIAHFNGHFFSVFPHCRTFNPKSKHIVWYTIAWMAPAVSYWVRWHHKRMRSCYSVVLMRWTIAGIISNRRVLQSGMCTLIE